MRNVAFMMISTDFEFARMTNQRIEEEVLPAAFIGRANKICERRHRHEIRAHDVFLTGFNRGNFGKVGDNAVGAGLNDDALAFAVGLRLGINHCNICAAVLVELKHVLEVDIVNVAGIGQEDILLAAKFGEVQIGVDVFKIAFARIVIGQGSGQVRQTVAAACQIPIFTGADMVEHCA